jgi:hypothetical protein
MARKMIQKNRTLILTLITVGFLFTGCISVNRDFKRIRTNIFENSNVNITNKFELGIGKSAISLVSLFVTFKTSEKEIDPGEYISQLNSVQIGQYKLGRKISDIAVSVKNITDYMKTEGWHYIVKHSSKKEITMIFLRDNMDNSELNDLFIINLQDNVLVLVDLNGELNHLIDIALRDRSLNVDVG